MVSLLILIALVSDQTLAAPDAFVTLEINGSREDIPQAFPAKEQGFIDAPVAVISGKPNLAVRVPDSFEETVAAPGIISGNEFTGLSKNSIVRGLKGLSALSFLGSGVAALCGSSMAAIGLGASCVATAFCAFYVSVPE